MTPDMLPRFAYIASPALSRSSQTVSQTARRCCDGEGPRLIPILLQIPQIVKYYPDPKFHEVIKVADLPIAAVVRIAKKNGAERVGSDAAAALVAQTEDYIANLVKEANRLAIHAGRKTLKDEDIELAVKAL